MKLFRFHAGYALLTLLVFVIEVLIALYVRDRFVRPYLGDVLAVILVYLGLRAVLRIGVATAAAAAFAVAVAVELGQLIGIVHLLGLSHSPVARTVLGMGFEAWDFVAYAAGAGIAILADAACRRRG
ncbi:ribosomal maturation YjgA family protein [Sphingomonas koreensis]